MLDTSSILHDLAVRIRAEHDAAESAKDAAVVAARKGVEHAIAAGELLLEAKAQVPHGQWLPWLAENCPTVSPRMAQYYMGLARKRPELESKCETVSHLTLREAVHLLNDDDEGVDEIEDDDVNGMEYVRGDGDHDDGWYSPEPIVEAFRVLFGGVIDLDPFSCPAAQEVVKATKYYTVADDAFKQSWAGRVLCNPPYDRINILPAVKKLIDEYRSGNVSEAGLLVFSNTGTRWWQAAGAAASAVCYPKGNLTYWHPDKGEAKKAPIPSTIFYFGPNAEKFCELFSRFGQVVRPDQGLATPAEDKAGPNGHSDEWLTPSQYSELVRDLFGGVIDVDPASCDQAQETIQAKRYYTKEDDGLKQPWSGRVFLNPPYSNPTPFIDKLIQHNECGDVPGAILMVHTNSSARWFQRALKACSALCFSSSRIKFKNPHIPDYNAPRYDSLFLYFGDDVERFRRLFASVGTVFVNNHGSRVRHGQMTVTVEFVSAPT